MAKRLSADDKKIIVEFFTNGVTVEELSKKFSCTKLTIIRNLKQNIGESQYKEFSKKIKSLNPTEIKGVKSKISFFSEKINNESSKEDFFDTSNINENISESEFSPSESFLEIAPLNYEIENSPRKEFSSLPISEIELPKMVYMIVDKNIELVIKILKDYPNWDFLPSNDLNRKTIEIYDDIKLAKRFCKKEQRVIKVPNTDVFRIVAPILISKGISRIVCSEQLISL